MGKPLLSEERLSEHFRYFVDQLGVHAEPVPNESTKTDIVIKIKRRSLLGRIKRLPGYLRKNWQFTKGAPFFDRVNFCWGAVKILLS